MLTAIRAKELFHYEMTTGILFRRSSCGAMKEINSISCGYIRTIADGKNYLAHRIAWLIVTGDWPEDQIDHINGIRNDNRWGNLRQVSNQQNQQNQRVRNTNKSGVTGVDWHSISKKWRAQITVNGKAIYLGVFQEIQEAEKARKDAEIKYGFHENHGRK